MTSQWSLLAVAARTAQPSVSSRAWAGVTPVGRDRVGRRGRDRLGVGEGGDARGQPAGDGAAGPGGAEDADPALGDGVRVVLARGPVGALAERAAQVDVGGQPQQRGRHAGDRLGRDEQAVDLVLDDLARSGRAVIAGDGYAGGHRLLDHEREALGPGGEGADAGLGPLAAHVGDGPGQLDPVEHAELADVPQQLLPLRSGAVDPQPPLGQLVGDLGERLDQPGELLLVDQPAGRHHERVVEARARREPERQRVRHDRDLGRGVAELLADPVGHRRGEHGDHVGAGGEVQQRVEAGRSVGRGAVLLVHHDGLGRQQLDGGGEQAGRDRDEDVELDARQHVLEADVAQRRELAVPPLGHEERLALVQRARLRRRQLDAGHATGPGPRARRRGSGPGSGRRSRSAAARRCG